MSIASDPHKLRFGGDCEGVLYLPRSESPAGAVVVLHERYGLAQHTLDLAQRLARDGYAALAPNLFSRWRGDAAALRSGKERVVLPDPEVAAVIDTALGRAIRASRPSASRSWACARAGVIRS